MDNSEEKQYRYVHSVCELRSLGKLFHHIRNKNELTTTALAKDIYGVSPASIFQFESGGYMALNKVVDCFDKMGYDVLVFAVKREEEEENGE
jgi:DNA-binding XRE family transcriptional regulator